MARQARGFFKIIAEFIESKTGLGASGAERSQLKHSIELSRRFTTGTGTDQIDRPYSATGTVDGTGTTVDLVGGLTSILDGSATSFVHLKGLILQNTGSVDLLVGGSTHPIPIFADPSDILIIPPGGCYPFDFGSSGLALVGGTSDEVKLAAASGTTDYKVLAWGTST